MNLMAQRDVNLIFLPEEKMKGYFNVISLNAYRLISGQDMKPDRGYKSVRPGFVNQEISRPKSIFRCTYYEQFNNTKDIFMICA